MNTSGMSYCNVWNSGVIKNDWRTLSPVTSLQKQLSAQEAVTEVVQAAVPDRAIVRARIKSDCLHVLVEQGVWVLPIKDQLYQLLPSLSEKLSVPLLHVTVNKYLASGEIE